MSVAAMVRARLVLVVVAAAITCRANGSVKLCRRQGARRMRGAGDGCGGRGKPRCGKMRQALSWWCTLVAILASPWADRSVSFLWFVQVIIARQTQTQKSKHAAVGKVYW